MKWNEFFKTAQNEKKATLYCHRGEPFAFSIENDFYPYSFEGVKKEVYNIKKKPREVSRFCHGEWTAINVCDDWWHILHGEPQGWFWNNLEGTFEVKQIVG